MLHHRLFTAKVTHALLPLLPTQPISANRLGNEPFDLYVPVQHEASVSFTPKKKYTLVPDIPSTWQRSTNTCDFP